MSWLILPAGINIASLELLAPIGAGIVRGWSISSLNLSGAVQDAGWLGENIQRPTTNSQDSKLAEGQRWLGGDRFRGRV
jgi:hypothetical protein